MKKATILQPLGLEKKTEMVYRTILGLADAPVSQIARHAGLKRTSCYHILENLATMGLVSFYTERGVKRFVAEHPSKLKEFFERQVVLAERAIPDFEKEVSKHISLASVRVFEGRAAVRGMSEEALQVKEKTILSIGSTKQLLEFLGGKYGWGKRRREQRIFQRALRFSQDETVDSPTRFHDIRILPDSFAFPGYLLIFENSVAIILFQEPARGIIVTDQNFSVMARSLFNTLWELLGEKSKRG